MLLGEGDSSTVPDCLVGYVVGSAVSTTIPPFFDSPEGRNEPLCTKFRLLLYLGLYVGTKTDDLPYPPIQLQL